MIDVNIFSKLGLATFTVTAFVFFLALGFCVSTAIVYGASYLVTLAFGIHQLTLLQSAVVAILIILFRAIFIKHE